MLPEFSPAEKVSIRLATTPREVEAAQHLRYKVFYEEYGATPSETMKNQRRDFDDYDRYADHLIVIDHSIPDTLCNGLGVSESAGGAHGKIVGTYRLLQRHKAEEYGQFYTSSEYDLAPLLNCGSSLLELGRSCVLPEYRTRPILQLLWQGIADYISERNIELMFGCASLHGTDVDALAESLSYLYHFHLSPQNLCPRALDSRYVDMNMIPKDRISQRRAFNALPPLIKGYLRVGATIGEGAVVDEQFNTTDVCIVVQTNMVTQRYRKHYERKIQKTFPGQETLMKSALGEESLLSAQDNPA